MEFFTVILVPFGFFVLCGLVIRFLIRMTPRIATIQRENQLATQSIVQIDQMDGRQFEQYLEVLFRYLGYQVELTRYMGDYGADLVLRQGEVRAVVQAKRYRTVVGIKSVQEVVASKGYYGCSEAMVVTNSRFTDAAQNLARANNVVLWDRDKLMEAVRNMQQQSGQHYPQQTHAQQYYPQASADQAADGQPQAYPQPNVSFRTSQEQKSATRYCASCGAALSPRVVEFCLARPERFGGRTYCMYHQKYVRHVA